MLQLTWVSLAALTHGLPFRDPEPGRYSTLPFSHTSRALGKGGGALHITERKQIGVFTDTHPSNPKNIH